MAIKLPPCPPLTAEGFASSAWQRWLDLLRQALAQAYTPDNPQLSSDTPSASAAGLASVRAQLSSMLISLATAPDSSAAVAQLRRLAALLNTAVTFTSVVTTGDITAGGKFGCNAAAAQAAAASGAALIAYAAGANGLATGAAMQALVVKVQAIDAALKANGICS